MKETVEEAAKGYVKSKWGSIFLYPEIENSFIEGAKWQAERMYSELSIYLEEQADKDRLKSLTSNQIRAMIEQFKKK